MTYEKIYARSLADPEGFWAEAASLIDWYDPPSRILDDRAAPLFRWYQGGTLNTCHNALDRHADGERAGQLALVYDSPVTGTVRTYTYAELRDDVARLAGALASLGIGKGDRVIIYMPMIPEAVKAMLACARIGAVHSVVFGGFAANELATRIDDARPKAILSASCGIEPARIVEYKPLIDAACEIATHQPETVVVLQRPQARAGMRPGRDVDWSELVAGAAPVGCVPVAATDPLYVLYTSGTTGQPKGVVRDNGGHAVALAWSMKNLYGVDPGEVYWAASDVGWVVGHSYIVYGPLIHGCTSILYEGKPVGTPDPGAFWRVISQHGVSVLFTAPTAFRAIKRDDPEARHLERGAIVVKLPLPPGTLPTLWNADDRYVESYLSRFPGYYLTADAGFRDGDGYFHIMSRIDDIINVAGHRLSTAPTAPPRSSRPSWWRWCGRASGRWRRSSGRSRSPGSPRPGPARFSGARCAASPTAGSGRCRRRSTTRPSSTRSPRRWQPCGPIERRR